MEAIFGFILLLFGYSVVKAILRQGARKVKEVVTGKETYYGPAQLKFVDEKLEDSDIVFKKIMFRGAIPVPRTMRVAFSVSAFDSTERDEGLTPIISMIESVQESETRCFGLSNEIGSTDEGDTFTDWVQLGAISPDLIQGPASGNRNITILVRMFNVDDPPTINAGFTAGDGEVILAEELTFEHVFTEKGYREEAKDREEAQALSLKVGVAVAMADGSLDDSEGQVLKDWIIREISTYSEETSQRLKTLFNDALKEGFTLAQSGELALSPLVDRLAEIGEKKTKYDAVELCFDVMAADGVADIEEMAVIRRVAEALDLDMDEIEKMREGVTLNLSASLSTEAGLESLVGLEGSWSEEKKRRHLRTEFQKWSNRLNSLSEGDEREAAQAMLDNIASLRKKYA